MTKKILIAFALLFAFAFLFGCSDESSTVVGSYKNMEVTKSVTRFDKFDCDNNVELKKGKNTIKMCATRNVKGLLKKGNIVDVYYDRDMFIQKVKFPDFEGDKAND